MAIRCDNKKSMPRANMVRRVMIYSDKSQQYIRVRMKIRSLGIEATMAL